MKKKRNYASLTSEGENMRFKVLKTFRDGMLDALLIGEGLPAELVKDKEYECSLELFMRLLQSGIIAEFDESLLPKQEHKWSAMLSTYNRGGRR